MVVASGEGIPRGAGLDSPVVGITAPITLRGDVQPEGLGGGFTWHPEVVWGVVVWVGDVVWWVVGGPVDFNGQRWLSVVTVSPGGGVGRAARTGQGGVETLLSKRGGSGTAVETLRSRRGGSGTAGTRPGEGGEGRRGSARSPGQSAVTQRDVVEALF